MMNLTFNLSASSTALDIWRHTGDDDFLLDCWPHFSCESCLSSPYPCSWCAVSSTCVPNTLMPHPFAILSPLKTESICPLSWRERWELRAKPFSCRCSTMTLMSVVVAVLATLMWVLLVHLLTMFTRWSVRRWKRRGPRWFAVHEGWRPACSKTATGADEHDPGGLPRDDERQPLLA